MAFGQNFDVRIWAGSKILYKRHRKNHRLHMCINVDWQILASLRACLYGGELPG